MSTTASEFNIYCDKLGFHKVHNMILKSKVCFTKIPIKPLSTSLHTSNENFFTITEVHFKFNYVLNDIMNIEDDSRLGQ